MMIRKKGEMRKRTWHGDKHIQGHKHVAIAFFSSSFLILKLSWKGPGITGHYDETETFLFAQVTWR